MYSDLFLQQQSQRSFPKVFVVAIVAFLGLAVGQVFIWYASVPTRASDVKLIQQTPVNISDTEDNHRENIRTAEETLSRWA
jgi:hypothetical protein